MRDRRISRFGAVALAVSLAGGVLLPQTEAQGFSFGFSTPEGVSLSVGTGGWQSAPLWMAPAIVPASAVIAAPVYYGESPKHYRKRVKKMRKAMRRASSGAWGAVELPGGIVVNMGVPLGYDDDWYDDDDWDDHHHHHKYHKKLYKERKKYLKKLHKHHKHHKHHHDDD